MKLLKDIFKNVKLYKQLNFKKEKLEQAKAK